MNIRRQSLVVLLVLASPGCLAGEGEQCSTDADCADDGECTRTGECVPDGAAVRVSVQWTVGGQTPTPAAPEPCEPLGDLEIVFHDPGEEATSYRPVPCELGQAVYDKMPPRFESVEVVAYDPAGAMVDAVEEPLSAGSESSVQVDLTPALSSALLADVQSP
jgi:hypothetical protein